MRLRAGLMYTLVLVGSACGTADQVMKTNIANRRDRMASADSTGAQKDDESTIDPPVSAGGAYLVNAELYCKYAGPADMDGARAFNCRVQDKDTQEKVTIPAAITGASLRYATANATVSSPLEIATSTLPEWHYRSRLSATQIVSDMRIVLDLTVADGRIAFSDDATVSDETPMFTSTNGFSGNNADFYVFGSQIGMPPTLVNECANAYQKQIVGAYATTQNMHITFEVKDTVTAQIILDGLCDASGDSFYLQVTRDDSGGIQLGRKEFYVNIPTRQDIGKIAYGVASKPIEFRKGRYEIILAAPTLNKQVHWFGIRNILLKTDAADTIVNPSAISATGAGTPPKPLATVFKNAMELDLNLQPVPSVVVSSGSVVITTSTAK